MMRRMFSTLFTLAIVLGLAGPVFADTVVDGNTGPGSVYRLVRPTDWNGILLLYAHGYVSKDEPVGITAKTSRPASAASITSHCPGRKSS